MSNQGKFMIYCAEQYKLAKHLTGYEALHTTGTNYIIDDIDLYIEARKPTMTN